MSSLPAPLLIVPGYQGSNEGHWQQWLHQQCPDSRLLTGIDWNRPLLADWAERIREELAYAREPLWIVAHSFGCLASIVAAADRPQSVAALVLVAPADPRRFNLLGLGRADDRRLQVHTLADVLPNGPLEVPGVLIASANDPWLDSSSACSWAQTWQLELQNIGNAGHINVESGFGPWPDLLGRLAALRLRLEPVASVTAGSKYRMPRGRGSVLARVRRHTRLQIELLSGMR